MYDFEKIDEIMTDCDELGLRLLLGIVIEMAPYWLEREFPNARFVNARARAPLSGVLWSVHLWRIVAVGAAARPLARRNSTRRSWTVVSQTPASSQRRVCW